MMLSVSYLLYSVNYLVCLLITTRIIRLENICMLVWDLWFTINHPCPRAPPRSQVLIEHKSQATLSRAQPMHYSPKVVRTNELARLVIVT